MKVDSRRVPLELRDGSGAADLQFAGRRAMRVDPFIALRYEWRIMPRSTEVFEQDTGHDVQALASEIAKRVGSLRSSTTQDLRGVRREFSRRLKGAVPSVVIELAGRLLNAGRMDFRFIAYELINKHPSALASLKARQLKRLGRGIASWGAVDCFGVLVAGPVWRERGVPDSLIHGWARSKDRWWRRAALVSTVPLNSKSRGGQGDTRRTVQVCRLLERDRDPMVARALSWALRELAKRDPRAVREYLVSSEGLLPALVRREVNNKLKTGVKNPKKR